MTDSAEPAFPNGLQGMVNFDPVTQTVTPVGSAGLTKRELAAFMAMQGFAANSSVARAMAAAATARRCNEAALIAEMACEAADALLAELERAVSMERRDG